MKFSIKDFFRKCDQICRTLGIWSHLLDKSLMEKFIFLCSDFLQPDFLIHKINQDVFVKLGNRNRYDESVSLIADVDETKFKLGAPNVQIG